MRRSHLQPSPAVDRRRQRGNAIIEASLLAPWVFFLFMAVLDFGFYNYALITTENAARVAAHYASNGDRKNATDLTNICRMVLAEMSALPNTRSLTTCVASAAELSDTTPVAVSSRLLDPPTNPGPAGDTAAEVTVSYRTIPLIPLPFLRGQLTITRVKQMSINIY